MYVHAKNFPPPNLVREDIGVTTTGINQKRMNISHDKELTYRAIDSIEESASWHSPLGGSVVVVMGWSGPERQSRVLRRKPC